uniref:Prostaglandin E2 receptor EP2 subtype n=1 Tax=Sphenodon punctatus TaxID=8508 RepID=A0A8D0G8H6_SPHPU
MKGTRCEEQTVLPDGESPAIAAVMFSAGLLGNLTALGLLLAGRRRSSRTGRPPLSPFQVLLSGLVVTDLLGTCLVSPVVLASYGLGRTLLGLTPGGSVCRYFAFAMSFFGLATMLALLAMALERSLALGAPYFYQRLLASPRAGLLLAALPALDGLAALFCALPLLLDFGRFVQYCPGTWCFIQMHPPPVGDAGGSVLIYSLLYASLLLLLILAVLLCNLTVILNLVRMHRRGPVARCRLGGQQPQPAGGAEGGCGGRRRLSMTEELDHLILLSLMTVIFLICSLPFTIRAFMNKFIQDGDYKEDLRALRFLSINSIIDPWVFAILRPSVLRLMRSVLCCQMPPKTEDNNARTSPTDKSKSAKPMDLCRQ